MIPEPDIAKICQDNQIWYANALEVLNPLRYHLHMIIESIESPLNSPILPTVSRQIDEAKKALEAAENFLSGRDYGR